MTSIDENENTPRETRQAGEQSDHPEPPISPALQNLSRHRKPIMPNRVTTRRIGSTM